MRPNLKKIGKNIKRLRHRKGISQEALARKANLTLSNLAKLEGGFSKNPTLTTLLGVAKVLSRGSIDKIIK